MPPRYADRFALSESGLWLRDNTINDVSVDRHGFAPKLPNDSTKFLNGVGGYTVPPGTAGDAAITGSRGPLSTIDSIPASPNADDHEFLNGDTIGGTTLGSPATAPAILNHRLVITGGQLGTADAKGVVWSFTGAGTPWTVTAKVRNKNLAVNYHIIGILLRNSVSGRYKAAEMFRNPSGLLRDNIVGVSDHTGLTSRTFVGSGTLWNQSWAYVRMTDDGTNIVTEFSEDGLSDNWHGYQSEARGTWFTSSQFPNQFGVFVDTFSTNTPGIAFFDWIRIT